MSTQKKLLFLSLVSWSLFQASGLHATLSSIGKNYLAAFLGEGPHLPPISRMDVGPEQILVGSFSVIRSFNKATGKPDGVIDITPDFFFGALDLDYILAVDTCYDPFADRWYILGSDQAATPSKVFLAVSDGGVLTPATKWSFFTFSLQGVLATQSFGFDNQAIYIGAIDFDIETSTALDTFAMVIQKQSLFDCTQAPVVTRHSVPVPAGPYTGWSTFFGVRNYDANATIGYFAGYAFAGTAVHMFLIKVINPGSATPIFSAPFEVPITQYDLSFSVVRHNLQPVSAVPGLLKTFIAVPLAGHIRNDHMFFSYTVGTDNVGSASGMQSRNGCAFCEVDVNALTQVQSALVFQPSPMNDVDQRNYFASSVMTNGQGHLAMGFSAAGADEYVNAGLACRFASDPLNTIGAPSLYTNATAPYIVQVQLLDPEPRNPWNDISSVVLDPDDAMTMYALQEYTFGIGLWGIQVAQILAPPPAIPSSIFPVSVPSGVSSTGVMISGASINNSAFYDPGAGFAKRLAVSISGGVVVNTISAVFPTSLVVDIDTTGVTPGAYNIMVTNPDGQHATGLDILIVT